MERTPCKKCFGKGKTTIKNEVGFDISVACPVCGGSGYDNIYGIPKTYNYELDEELDNEINNNELNLECNITEHQDKDKILNQIIKYPNLFTDGIYFPYNDENIEIFIYLKNNYIFDIEQKSDSLFIKLKPQYKNKLAVEVINKLKGKK